MMFGAVNQPIKHTSNHPCPAGSGHAAVKRISNHFPASFRGVQCSVFIYCDILAYKVNGIVNWSLFALSFYLAILRYCRDLIHHGEPHRTENIMSDILTFALQKGPPNFLETLAPVKGSVDKTDLKIEYD